MILQQMMLITEFLFCASLLLLSKEVSCLSDARPPSSERTFQSSVIDSIIDTLTPLLKDKNLAKIFTNCFPNTLDTTVYYHTPSSSFNEGNVNSLTLDTFIITGDIPALWLRDSANQIVPYLPYGPKDGKLQSLFQGLISRHARSILIDPFANSFNFNASGEGHQDDMRTPRMTPSVFEGKYEIDSLCAFFKVSYWHWRFSGDSVLDRYGDFEWIPAVEKALNTIEIMQVDDGKSSSPPYLFQRLTSVASDTLIMNGRGPPSKPTGLSRSLFRPSDDAVSLPYNIPDNAMACVEVKHIMELLERINSFVSSDKTVAETGAMELRINKILLQAKEISSAICSSLSSIITSRGKATQSDVIPYEVDGYGSEYFMDDANIPSLLSLPTVGFMSSSHPSYKTTRSYVLSTKNPYFFSGSDANGVGGPHIGYNYSWPMAIITRAMTSDSDEEINECLSMLVKSSADTGFMHESFNVNNVNDYTRDWFAWANGLFGEMVLQLVVTKPHLVLIDDEASIKLAQSVVFAPVSLLSQQEAIHS